MTKLLLFSLFCLLLASSLQAQKSRYAVEVGAFAEGVDLSYFRKLDYTVYESVDVNTIFRYYIDVSDEAEGARVRDAARNAGHRYARVVDFELIAAQCANQCGYQPRTATRKGNPSTMKVADNPTTSSSTSKNNRPDRERRTSLTVDSDPTTPTRKTDEPKTTTPPKDPTTNTTVDKTPQRTPSQKTTTTTTNTTTTNTPSDPNTKPTPTPKKYKTVFDKEAGKYIRVPIN